MSYPDDIKSSANVWGNGNDNTSGNYNHHTQNSPLSQRPFTTAPSDLPPSYTNATSTQAPSPSTPARRAAPPPPPNLNPLQDLLRLSSINLKAYSPPDSALSDDRTTTSISTPSSVPAALRGSTPTTLTALLSDSTALFKLIQEQASLPPKPMMVIRGTHISEYAKETVDFELELSLMGLISLENSTDGSQRGNGNQRARTVKVKAIQPEKGDGRSSSSGGGSRLFRGFSGSGGEMSNSGRNKRNSTSIPAEKPTPLQIWTKRFCDDRAENKSFILHRTTPFLLMPRQILEGHIRTMLATQLYRGKITISFPIQYSSFVIHKRPGNWFANMLGVYQEKKYEVVEVVWNLRTGDAQHDESDHESGNAVEGGEGRIDDDGARLAQEWWNQWADAIRNGVLRRHRGKVGVEDWVEAKMGLREQAKASEWGFDKG